MTTKDARILEELGRLTPEQLARRDPELAAMLAAKRRDRIDALARNRLRNTSVALFDALGDEPIVAKDASEAALRDAILERARAVLATRKDLASDSDIVASLEALAAANPPATETPTRPLALDPDFRDLVAKERLVRVASAMRLGASATAALAEHVERVDDLTSERLDELVAKDTLSEADARRVGEGVALYRVLDERMDLVDAVAARTTGLAALAKLDVGTWKKLVEDSGTRPPLGFDAEGYAQALAKKVARLAPAAALGLAIREDAGVVVERNRRLDVLRRGGKVAIDFDAPFTDFDTNDVDENERAALASDFEATRRAVRRLHGLGIEKVLGDASLDDDTRRTIIDRRMGLATSFLDDNPDILTLDLAHGGDGAEALVFADGTTEDEKQGLTRMARAYSRVWALTSDVEHARQLMEGGYASAYAVASSDPTTVALSSGVTKAQADKYYAESLELSVNLF